MGWLNRPGPEEHRCDLPGLPKELSAQKWVTKWVWQCDVCGVVYKVGEQETDVWGPMWEWYRAWPWTVWRYRLSPKSIMNRIES